MFVLQKGSQNPQIPKHHTHTTPHAAFSLKRIKITKELGPLFKNPEDIPIHKTQKLHKI